ncbi:MAG: flagellar protein [Calditrichaeota bacterium]|nr:flagellar protein [Calditrichota bacterium]
MTELAKIPPIARVESPAPVEATPSPRRVGKESFSQVLDKTLGRSEPLAFSAHARARLLERRIELTASQMDRLEKGVGQAAEKGAKDSLVLLDNLALLVSIRNRTVITAMDDARMRENVFTQIDSTVIV